MACSRVSFTFTFTFFTVEITEKIQYVYCIYPVLLLVRTIAVNTQAMYESVCSLRYNSNTPAKLLLYIK